MDQTCLHCGGRTANVRFRSQLKRKRSFVNKAVKNEIGTGNQKWFDELTKQTVQRCSTSQFTVTDFCKSLASTQHSSERFHAVTPGGGNLTPLSTWALLATQDTSTSRISRPLPGVSPKFASTPKPETKENPIINISKDFGLDDSYMSWTSSMETPSLKKDSTDVLKEEQQEDKSESLVRIKGLPRALFTPDQSGMDCEDFGHILEFTGDSDTLINCPPLGSSPPVEPHFSSPILKRKVNKRLSFGIKCDFEHSSVIPNNKERNGSENIKSFISGESESVTKVKCDKGDNYSQSEGMPSQSTSSSIIGSVLSAFFDSPASEKRREAPKGVKRKAVEMESLEDELRILYSSGSLSAASQNGLQSILSSVTKHKAPKRKWVRFADDVKKTDQNDHSLRKRKLSKTVSYKEQTGKENQNQNQMIDIDPQDEITLSLKDINLNSNNSCNILEGGESNYLEDTSKMLLTDVSGIMSVTIKTLKNDVTEQKSFENRQEIEDQQQTENWLKNRSQRQDENKTNTNIHNSDEPKIESFELLPSDTAVKNVLEQEENQLTPDNATTDAVNDDLFSQVSPTVWYEMCQVSGKETSDMPNKVLSDHETLHQTDKSEPAEPSENMFETRALENKNFVSTTLETNPKSVESENDKNVENKNRGLCVSRPRKFLYPSSSQISHVCPQHVFKFNNHNTEILFDDVDDEVSFKHFGGKNSGNVDSKGKNVRDINDNAQQKEQNESVEEKFEICNETNESVESLGIQNKDADGLLPSFSTTGGKIIKCHQDALNKAESLLKIDNPEALKLADPKQISSHAEQTEMESKRNKLESLNCKFSDENSLLLSAGNRGSLKCNSDAVEKELSFLNDEENSKMAPSFSTANGKIIKCDQTAILKAQSLLECEQDESKFPELSKECGPSFSNVESLKSIHQKQNLGFSTASGKFVNCNENALKKAETLFAQIDDSDSLPSFSLAAKINSEENINSCKKILPLQYENSNNTVEVSDHLSLNMSEKDVKKCLEHSDKETANYCDLELENCEDDKFEEIFQNILENKKKASIPKINNADKNFGFQECSGIKINKSDSIKMINPVLKPKGFQPFKKPKQIALKQPEMNTNTKTAQPPITEKQIKNDIECGQSLQQNQLEVTEDQNKDNTKKDQNDIEMNEMMLKEFSHDIFSQCISQNFMPKTNNPTTNRVLSLSHYEKNENKESTISHLDKNEISSKSNMMTDDSEKYEDLICSDHEISEYDLNDKSYMKNSDETKVTVQQETNTDKSIQNLSEEENEFDMASDERIQFSEQFLLKVKENLVDEVTEHDFEMSQMEISDLEMSFLSQNNSCDNRNDNPNSDVECSDHDFDNISKQQSNSDYKIALHPLLTGDTLFEDINGNQNEVKLASSNECKVEEMDSKRQTVPDVSIDTCDAKQIEKTFTVKEGLEHDKLTENEDSVINYTSPSKGNCVFQTDSEVSIDVLNENLESVSRANSLFKEKVLFQTASGKDVTVCEESVRHARSLWNDESAVQTVCKPSSSTAVDKNATVSKSSINKAISDRTGPTTDEVHDFKTSHFQTASGKNVAISDSSVRHAQSLWEDESQFPLEKRSVQNLFQTASGKNMTLSETSLEHAECLWKDESTISQVVTSSKNTNLFQTASGKDVTISETSLKHAKSLWKDESRMPQETMSCKKTNLFQTASGKDVTISQASLKHAKSLWKDESRMPQETMSCKKTNLFQTASGKDVIVSEDSLKHAKSLWKDESIESATKASVTLSGVFQTASGKKVNIAETSLDKAKSLWKDEASSYVNKTTSETLVNSAGSLWNDEFLQEEPESVLKEAKCFEAGDGVSESDIDKHKGFTMFQTALGKTVSVSESSVNKVKDLWKDEGGNDNIKYSSVSDLFKTASGKLVKVSQTSLENTKTVLNDQNDGYPISSVNSDENVDKQRQKKTYSSSVCAKKIEINNPFQTASGSKVMISESALQNTKKMFNDIDSNPLETNSLLQITSENVEEFHKQPFSNLQTSLLSKDKGKSTTHSVNNSLENNACRVSFNENFEKTEKYPECGITMNQRKSPVFNSASHNGKTTKNESFTHSLQDKERVIKRKVLRSVPEVFHTDRWSMSGKHTEALYSDTLSERKNEYKLENLVGKPESGPPSDFKTPYKRSPFVPSAQNTSKPEVKKSKAPIFYPKSAIKCIQTSNKQKISTFETPSGQAVDGGTECFADARQKQEEIIKAKKKQKIRPVCGRLSALKSNHSRYKYSDLSLQTDLSVSQLTNFGIHTSTFNISSTNAQNYRFDMKHFYPSLQSHVLVGDGAFLVADDKGFSGHEEFYRGFLTIQGVDPSLVTEAWITNHYRWIVWKLATYEIVFPLHFGGRSLTPDSVMFQLKYRYDREIDNCQRSCLKKIMEKDDTACKRMILCVAGISSVTPESSGTKKNINGPEVFLELTDSWYSIKGKMDGALLEMVERKRIVVGQKLCISGAELGGSEDACSPLEAPASLFLKMSMNSTRHASWDSRLGYMRFPCPLCVSICSLHCSGGLVGCVDAVVQRVYPVMYMEKKSDGSTTFRTAEAEERIQRQFEQIKQAKMEKLYDKIQAKFEKEEIQVNRKPGRKLRRQDVERLQSGLEIFEAVESSLNPEELHSWLSAEQQHLMEEHQRRCREQIQQQLQADFQKAWEELPGDDKERKVTPVLKIRIVGCSKPDIDSKTTTLVTIWRPTPDWMDLKEGKRYKFYSLTSSSAKSRLHSYSVHLTASRQSCVKEKKIDENYLDLIYEPREMWKVRDLCRRAPPNNEFDFVGVVVEISSDSDKRLNTVYSADVDGDIIAVRFWGGIQNFGLNDILQEGKVFVAKNLVLKWSHSVGVVTVDACMEVSHFSHTSNSQEQRKHLEKLKNIIQVEKENFLQTAKTRLSNLQRLRPVFPSESKLPTATAECNQKQLSKQCLREKSDAEFLDNLPPDCVQSLFSPMDESFNSQRDIGSTSSDENLIKKQKEAVHNKMAKLLLYSSPKPLSPLSSGVSPAAFKKFKSPLNP